MKSSLGNFGPHQTSSFFQAKGQLTRCGVANHILTVLSRHSCSCSYQWKLHIYNLHRRSPATPRIRMRMTSPRSNKSGWRCRTPTTRRCPLGPSECGLWVSSSALSSPSSTSFPTTGVDPSSSTRPSSKLLHSPSAGSWRRFCQRLGISMDPTPSPSIRVPSTWRSTLWYLYLQMPDVACHTPS